MSALSVLVLPLVSEIPSVDAVRTPPTAAVPVIPGLPVAATLTFALQTTPARSENSQLCTPRDVRGRADGS